MPGFTTHYLFGQQTYQSLRPSGLKQDIQKYHHVFSLGLQGPDIFFYDFTAYLFRRKNPGSIAHTMSTGAFLRHLIESPGIFLTQKEQKIAHVYIFGFTGHYLLDSRCHPYIYAKAAGDPAKLRCTGRHIRLETDIDATLLWFYQHRRPSEFHQSESIALTREQMTVVSTMLFSAFQKTYPGLPLSRKEIVRAIHMMQRETKYLYDPNGYKKILVRRIETIIPGYPLLSSLIPSDTLIFSKDPCNTAHKPWRNPWAKEMESTESFFELFEAARTEYSRILNDTARFFSREHTPSEEERALTLLLRRLGSRCYHSGLSSAPYLL